jgi:hypothetical protein
MSEWTAKELAGKAKRPKVWEKLQQDGTCEDHRPSIYVISQAIDLLESEGNLEAANRVKVFRGHRRENTVDIDDYDS